MDEARGRWLCFHTAATEEKCVNACPPSVVGGSCLGHDLSEMPPVPSSCILYGPGLGVTHHRQSLLSSCCRGVRKLSFTRRCCVVWGESEYRRNLFLSLWKHYWTQSY